MFEWKKISFSLAEGDRRFSVSYHLN